MQASEFQGAAMWDCRQEQALLRKAAESEAKFKHAVEAKRQAITERCAELQEKLSAAEEELRHHKEIAFEIQQEAHVGQFEERQKARSLVQLWPQVEQAAAAAKAADDRLVELRKQAEQKSEDEQHQLAVSSGIYQMYAASTGIRWDLEARDVEGYIAIDKVARPFKVRDLGSKDSADQLWSEIEACLPKRSSAP
eukprot:TRINITY_DN58222_c0_g1_i1.p1 TRINITY_DN58222_c0_g1~~TRINITY_DN58222_c0_g1_i1.p1  ORF type:complete len:195 (-),score=68.11 TRINITY_DN58222_c0_g1_i1:527-1111(-)